MHNFKNIYLLYADWNAYWQGCGDPDKVGSLIWNSCGREDYTNSSSQFRCLWDPKRSLDWLASIEDAPIFLNTTGNGFADHDRNTSIIQVLHFGKIFSHHGIHTLSAWWCLYIQYRWTKLAAKINGSQCKHSFKIINA